MIRSRPSSSVVGLDIEPTRLTAAEVDVNGAISVRRAATAPLAAGLIRDGEVIDPAGLAAALRDFFKDTQMPKRVRVGVANQRIVVRTLELPPVTDRKELEQAVRFVAADQLPMPLEQAVIDFHPLGIIETPAGPRQQVVLVAARRDMVERLLGAVKSAGLRAEGVDLSAFALVRALRPQAAGEQGAVVYLSIDGLTNLAVAEGSICRFTRTIAGGLEAPAAELAGRRGITVDEARSAIAAADLRAVPGEGDELAADAASILHGAVTRIADEVRSSLDFHSAQDGVGVAGRCLLAGPAARIPGFADVLGAGLGLPVEPAFVASSSDGALGGIYANDVAVAAGLAVEESPA